MTENAVSPKPSFVSSILPWLIAAAALVIYLVTLNPWVSLTSLPEVSRVSGWMWQPVLIEPLNWLVTYPFRWLPFRIVPVAMNMFSASCAVLTLKLLARSVALLPHDRTHEQRQREVSPFSLLSVPTAWLPPVLAALVCGLQLTFWERATAASGDMLDLLIFAYVIRCLLEFRIDERESWLSRAAFVYALGMTNNWAMIGFLPLFLAALVWIRGLSFFNFGFLGRMFLCGMIGLLLYLLLPIVQSRSAIAAVPFWQALKSNLGNQEGVLAAFFKNSGLRQLIALLGLTSLLPILVIGIRWASYFGDTSKLGIALATIMFHVVHALFLIACTWVALDPPFSPRHMGYGMPFLTFYYLGALSVGYFSGYFLLVFRGRADRSRRGGEYLSVIHGAATCALWLLLLVVPIAMVSRNLPQIRATNGSLSRQTGKLLIEGLPSKGAAVISDDPKRLYLAQAATVQSGQDQAFMFLDSGSLQYPQYQHFLKKCYGERWTAQLPKVRDGLVGPLSILSLLSSLQRSNTLYYLQPSFGYYFEFFYLEPHGLVYEMFPYPSNSPFPPATRKELLAENESFWARADAQAIDLLLPVLQPRSSRANPGLMDRFDKLAHLEREPNRDASLLAPFYSRALDYLAVDLQRNGQVAPAAAHFARALDLNPDNVAARVSLECNKQLREGAPTPVKLWRAVEDSFGSKYRDWNQVVAENGPFDEPTFCYAHAQWFVQGRLPRQAMQEFERVTELDPLHLGARLWLAQLYVMVQQPDEALRIVQEIHRNEAGFGIDRTNITEFMAAEASAYFAKKDSLAAQAVIEKTLQQFAAEKELRASLLAVATQIYLNAGFFSNALASTELQLQLAPNNPSALANKGYAYLQLGAFDLAIPPLTRVIELQSTNYSALLNRAIAYLRGGKLDEAQQDYEALQKAVPLSFSIFYGLGEIAYRRKDTNAAIYNYELYLANAPRNPQEIKFVTTRLEELKKGPH